MNATSRVIATAPPISIPIDFNFYVSGPPDSEDQQRRLTCTLHALYHASRLAETASSSAEFRIVNGGSDDTRAVKLCAEAMRHATDVAGEVAARSADGDSTAPVDGLASLTMQNLTQFERNVEALEELRRSHRVATLGAVATGSLTTDEAMVRVDTVRSLEALTRHAWRSSANLVGLDK
jgi:phosphate:Na+ symporter